MNHTDAAVLSAEQIRNWDLFTMEKEFISSLELMERAAVSCFKWLIANGYVQRSFSVFCGQGNNGGDGLALARMLSEDFKVSVYILESRHAGTDDFQANLALLQDTSVEIFFIRNSEDLYPVHEGDIIIDALFGSGLNRPLEGIADQAVRHINDSGNKIISIDIPSGMYPDSSSAGNAIVKASHTVSFQAWKPAFLVSENSDYTGTVHILNIGLTYAYLKTIKAPYRMLGINMIKSIYRPRKNYSHKGTYGHAALVTGSENMMGAAVLAAKACLRSGAGKLTCYIPQHRNDLMQSAVPEAMTSTFTGNRNSAIHEGYDVVGIGPGLGRSGTNTAVIAGVLKYGKPLVIDADALNTLAENASLLKEIPPLSVITPHPKEFERLFGKADNDFERISMARLKAEELNIIIILKGYHSLIAMPHGEAWFNSTGNPGMATAGSGDVLTGIITGLLAQKYSPEEASLLGVYLHGLAGDIAAAKTSQEAMIASDITAFLGEAFLTL
jgi:NAD(P)H-hydrate epimerase